MAAPLQSFKFWSAAIFCRLHHTFYSGAKGSMEEHRLCKFENKVLKNKFVPKMVKVTQASNCLLFTHYYNDQSKENEMQV